MLHSRHSASSRLAFRRGAPLAFGLFLMLLAQSSPALRTDASSTPSFTRTLLQAGGDTGSDITATSGGAGTGVVTASATLPGDIAAVRSCLPFNILIRPGPPGTGGASAGGGTTTNATGAGNLTSGTSGASPANMTTEASGAGTGNTTSGTPGVGGTSNTTGTTSETAGAGAGNTTGTTPTSATAPVGTGGGNATLIMQAEMGVINATEITYSEADGILTLALTQGYSTSHAINLTIYTANSSSLRFVRNFGPGNLVVSSGFDVDTFSAATTSMGDILVKQITAGHVYVTSTGAGTVAVNGSFSGADVVVGGLATVYLGGNISGVVNVSVDFPSTLWIQGSTGTHITGTAKTMANVYYTGGTCDVKSESPLIDLDMNLDINIFGDPCKRASPSTGPNYTPLWSCGQEVRGQSVCPEIKVSGFGGLGQRSGIAASQPAAAGVSQPAATGAGNVNTVSGAPGNVTTGTFTTPGGTASASGTVSGPSGALGGQQISAGGSPPSFSPIGPVGGGNAASTGSNDTGSAASALNVRSGGEFVTSANHDLDIPSTSSGLAIWSTTCVDPPSSLIM
ncbi:hypothetical protein Vafri_13698 [Volvox africanus]|uniref:Auto-transporter adhesin head GIN domain-containing protein n=1 Tax=Volvox africanus TaxID=51714 RepID=A0A8J4BDJ7_9CHLO|nr:hypothetical protein Vafri_13698 [Volvox africanus]